ncbi:MAG: hypothetical protein AMK72_07125 [Planctomycetes bacterium SM23_25]|nr:MAG: hypothetical protein AMK72_07125 [Planctomycetes bacterium SM23_25]
MMETIKRHAFLLGLAAGVVVISLAVALMAYFFYVRPNASTVTTIKSTRSQAEALRKGRLFSKDLVGQMAEQVDRRKKQHEELLGYIKGLGAARKPLVEGLFPTSTDVNLRHSFKAAYDAAIAKFMTRLGAGTPTLPVRRGSKGKTEADDLAMTAAREAYRKFTLFAHPKQSFERPTWVDRDEAPSLELVRFGQEDIWLMEDLVEIIAQMNADVLDEKKKDNPNLPPVVEHAAVKELIDIAIGSAPATLPNTQMQSISGRYRPGPEAAGPADKSGRAPTLSGRYSNREFFLVLPWRLAVVVEARYAGELIRRLKGRETFLSVEAWRLRPITGDSFERTGRSLMANVRDDYGKQGVAHLEVVGESLVFQLAGGRVTTLVTATKAPADESAETPTSGE